MKVKFISTYPPTKCGIAEHANHLAKALKTTGIEPEIIRIEKPSSSNPLYFIKLAREATKNTSEKDIIHIQFHLMIFGKLFGIFPGGHIIVMLWLLKLLSKAKIVLALHDAPTKEYTQKGGKKEKILFYYYKFIYIFLRKYVDYFVSHTKKGEEIHIKEWKINPKKIITLPLGLPTEIIELNSQKCKKKLGYEKNKIIIILGFIRATKNYEIVIEALSKLEKNVLLLFAGKPQLEKDKVAVEKILKKAKELDVEKRVKILGFVSDEELPILLNASDIGIVLHTQGGGDFLSSTMAMQLAYNVPILSTNISSFENLKKQEKCLETFKENNSSDLVEKIKELLYNKSKINSLKKYTKKYWKENNWNEIGKKTKNLYLSLSK